MADDPKPHNKLFAAAVFVNDRTKKNEAILQVRIMIAPSYMTSERIEQQMRKELLEEFPLIEGFCAHNCTVGEITQADIDDTTKGMEIFTKDDIRNDRSH